MLPRLIGRTHYQVDEPAIMKIIVERCTSPTRGEYAERVAAKLLEEVRSISRDFNLPAARYAIDLARRLGLLSNNNLVWTDRGHLLHLVASEVDPLEYNLSLAERLVFFRLFLEADGGAIVYLARLLEGNQALPPPGKTWNDLANEMTIQVYQEYLEILGSLSARTSIRQVVERRRSRPYSGKSGAHQMFVHVQLLSRLGLVEREDVKNGRRYILRDSRGMGRLQSALPSIRALETAIAQRRLIAIAQETLDTQLPPTTERPQSQSEVFKLLACQYQAVMATGVSLCSISTIVEAMQIEQLVTGEVLVSHDDAVDVLRAAQRDWPREIRFHVDRAGRPAFIKMDSGIQWGGVN